MEMVMDREALRAAAHEELDMTDWLNWTDWNLMKNKVL